MRRAGLIGAGLGLSICGAAGVLLVKPGVDAIEAPSFVLWTGGTDIAIGLTLIAGAFSPVSTKLPIDLSGAWRFLRGWFNPPSRTRGRRVRRRVRLADGQIPGGIRPRVYMSPIAGPITLNPPLAADALIRLCPLRRSSVEPTTDAAEQGSAVRRSTGKPIAGPVPAR